MKFLHRFWPLTLGAAIALAICPVRSNADDGPFVLEDPSEMAGDGPNGTQPASVSGTGAYSQYHIGVDFITSTVVPDPGFIANFIPYSPLSPTSSFTSQGGTSGLTEAELHRKIVMAIEDPFRAIDTGDPQTTVAIAVHDGLLDPTLPGRRLNLAMGASASPVGLLGQSKQGAFGTNFPQDGYAGMTYMENIDAMGNGGAFVVYDTLPEVVFGIAGTAAHEVGHIFGAVHINTTATTNPQPLMATEGTGLPTAARFTARRFASVNASTILHNAGTVVLGDFNMDRTIDALDASAMFANWGQTDRLFQEGDATKDHLVDALDASVAFENWTGDSLPAPTNSMVSAAYDPLTGDLTVVGDHIVNWFIQSESGSLNAISGLAGMSSDSLYLTENAYRLGQTSLQSFSFDSQTIHNIGNGLTDLTLYYNSVPGAPLMRGQLTLIPEPTLQGFLSGFGVAWSFLRRVRHRFPKSNRSECERIA